MIRYKYVANSGSIKSKKDEVEDIHPIALSKKTNTEKDLAEHLVFRSGGHISDMMRSILMVFEGIEDLLAEGEIVNIDGFGSFQLGLSFKKNKKVDCSSRAESIEIKSVNLKASRKLKSRLSKAKFERYNPKTHRKRVY
jgi:nucleoid DNA-binding protein